MCAAINFYLCISECESLPVCTCICVQVCIHTCQCTWLYYIQPYMHIYDWMCGGLCMCVYVCLCEYVQRTSKAASDRKHYSSNAYPPLTAKTWHLSAIWATAGSTDTYMHAWTKALDHSLRSHSHKPRWDLTLDPCKVLLLFPSY